MKIMVLSHSSAADSFGGAEKSLVQLIDQWSELRPTTEFFVVSRTPEGRLQAELDERQVRHHSLDFGSWVLSFVEASPMDAVLNARMDSRAVAQITALMREFSPDLVVTNTVVAPWAAIAARTLGIPHAWMIHEFGDLDHGLTFHIGRDETFTDIDLLSDLVVANSVAVRDHLASWVPAEKLMIAYPVVDLHRVIKLAADRRINTEELASQGSLKTVMVGRICPSKGQSRLITAISVLKAQGLRVTATLVGPANPRDSDEVHALIDSLGVADRVHVVSENDNPFVFVRAADVAVMASDCEAFGRVTLEYFALGRAVIASRSGANPELVAEGETGWLFDPKNIDELVAALREAAADRDELARRGVAARGSVDDRLAHAYPVSDLVTRCEAMVGAGPLPMQKLPNVLREWLALPQHSEQHLQTMHERHTTGRATIEWRIGRKLTTPFRTLERKVSPQIAVLIERWRRK
jgi:glycosyltransferase involved in cell wall biosynthesis